MRYNASLPPHIKNTAKPRFSGGSTPNNQNIKQAPQQLRPYVPGLSARNVVSS